MQPLLQQLPALLGVIVGAVATYVVTAATERSRWRRQQSVRWDETRLAAYTEYANAIKKLISVSVRLAANRGVYPDDDWFAREVTIADLAQAEENRTVKWETVLMLGNDRVIIAGREWHQKVWRIMRIACGQTSDLSWREAIEGAGLARRRFYEAAKADLGVDIGESAEVYEWQMGKWMTDRPEGVNPASGGAGAGSAG